MTDQGFPVIEYHRHQSPREWGRLHGESYREGIHELFEIRLNLMREKNPSLSLADIERLAAEQWTKTERVDPALTAELEGICDGAAVTRLQLVVLNNYTDFRDIQLVDEGCSVVFVNRGEGPVAGQTWDMHGSAKNYVCCLCIPVPDSDDRMVVFSLVGCAGMTGYTSFGTVVGVNNINTSGAVAGGMWPVLVRQTLRYRTQREMADYLSTAEVTSGHAYLIASAERAEMWEIMPGLSECVGTVTAEDGGFLFHTNHCLGERAQRRERPAFQNSTTQVRYELLQKKIGDVRSLPDVYRLMHDHENYPRSICSHFQASSAGSVGHLWRSGGAPGDRRGRDVAW